MFRYKFRAGEEIPMEFIPDLDIEIDITGGDGELYQLAGYTESSGIKFSRYNNFPNWTVFDFWE